MKTFAFLSTSFLLVVAAGCSGPADPQLNCAGSGSATLAADIQPILDAKCVACHDASNATYGDYSTAAKTAEIVGKRSLYAGSARQLKVVDPGDLANSSFWLKLLGGSQKGRTGPRGENVLGEMPNDGTKMTTDELEKLKAWICSGAM